MDIDSGMPSFGRIMLDTSYSWLDFSLALTGPTVTLDGYPIRAEWGLIPLDVPAGRHHIKVHTRYGRPKGIAEIEVLVHPGEQVLLYYRAPAIMLIGGAIGTQPQQTPGIVLSLLVSVIPPLILLAVLLWLALR